MLQVSGYRFIFFLEPKIRKLVELLVELWILTHIVSSYGGDSHSCLGCERSVAGGMKKTFICSQLSKFFEAGPNRDRPNDFEIFAGLGDSFSGRNERGGNARVWIRRTPAVPL